MIIEKLKRKDLAEYKSFIDECFGGSNDIKTYEDGFNKTEFEIIVAKDSEKIIGSITFYKINLFTFSFQPALEIFNVCVSKENRGKKVAKSIFGYITEYAKCNGYKSIFLTCLDNAHDAHRLYESVGMAKTSSVKYVLNFE